MFENKITYNVGINGSKNLRKNIRGKRSKLKSVRELKSEAGRSGWPLAE